MLSQLIDTAPGFRAAVNVVQEQDDAEKAAAFLPTAKGAEALFDLGRQLEPLARERARLITGTYGIGKSHLALVLTMLYRGRRDVVEPVLLRLAEKHPGRTESLNVQLRAIQSERPYLVVLVEGDQDSFDAALVRGLQQALARVGMGDYMPPTYFSAAADRLRELMENGDAAERLEGAVRDEGIDSAARLLDRIESGGVELEDLKLFERVHQEVCFGARFLPETRLEATQTYQDAVRDLAGRFAGIVVIWDEFGAFMNQIVRDPGSGEGLAVQRFAEACQDSGDHPLHLYLIAHRHLASYMRRAKDELHLTPSQASDWEQDFKKVSGRFHEFAMESEPEELYSLIDDVLIQKTSNGWSQFARERDNDFEMLTDTAYRAELFHQLSHNKLKETVVKGCYPLAPMTAAFLPRIAELVAQNQRTLFTFLCRDDDPVATFLKQTPIPRVGERLPLITCDALWDYFEQAVREDTIGRVTYRRYRSALAHSSLDPEDALGAKLLKVLALFDLIREGDPERASELPAGEDQIALALDLRTDQERQAVLERLQELTRVGSSRVAVRTRDGAYRLIAGSGTELREAVEQLLEQRKPTLNVATFLRNRWGRSGRSQTEFCFGFEESLEALVGRPDVVSRTVEIVPVLPEEIESLRPWLKDIGDGEFKDGVLFVVLPTEDPHIGVVAKRSLALADNPQIIFARPPHPLQGLREVIARIDALEEVARQHVGLWGPQGERRDEWDAEYEEAVKDLTELMAPVGLRPEARELQLDCFWQGSPRSCRTWADVRALADQAMQTAFALAPRTTDEVMKSAKRDGLAAARRTVIDKLLDSRGPELLLRERDQAQARLVRLLQSFDMLKTTPKAHVGRPDPQVDPGSAAVWDYLQQLVQSLHDEPQDAAAVVRVLRSSPYGLGQRVIPLVFAAALREQTRLGNIVAERSGRAGQWIAEAINGETLDQVFARPEAYRFRFVDVSDTQRLAVEGLLLALGGPDDIPDQTNRLLAMVKERVTQWWGHLPHYCQQTGQISAEARRLRDEILRPLVHPDADAHRLLIERLSPGLGDVRTWGRERFADAFTGLLSEMEGSVDKLPARIPAELRDGLLLDCEAAEESVVQALHEWYAGCSEETREYCHQQDAGKLQGWLRTADAGLVDLCAAVMGRPIEEWSDAYVGHFVGRIQSAQRVIEEWRPAPPAPDVSGTETGGDGEAKVSPGTALLTVSADLGDGPVRISRRFSVIRLEQFSETAKVLLRLLTANLADDQSLRDDEKENVLLQLVRRVFGDA
ncbi:MAG: hypothetical protein AB7Y46_14105 [Armatimonadota bacterium]